MENEEAKTGIYGDLVRVEGADVALYMDFVQV